MSNVGGKLIKVRQARARAAQTSPSMAKRWCRAILAVMAVIYKTPCFVVMTVIYKTSCFIHRAGQAAKPAQNPCGGRGEHGACRGGDFLFRGEVVLADIISHKPESGRHERPLHRGSIDHMTAGFQHSPQLMAGLVQRFRPKVFQDAYKEN